MSQRELPADFLERIDPEAFSVPDLIGLVVADHGAPLSLEDIAAMLADLGVVRSVPSLRKTWARLRCLRKTADGKLEVVREPADFCAWRSLAFRVREHLDLLERPPAAPEREKPPIDDTSPVQLEEVLRGLEGGLPPSISLRRKLALLAEANGGPLAVDRALELFSEAGLEVTEESVRLSVGGPLSIDGDGRVRQVSDSGYLVVARGLLRKRLGELHDSAEREKQIATRGEAREREFRIQSEEKRVEYLKARKACIRCVFTREGFAAGSVLDPDRREFHDFTEAAELASRLAECDIVFGLDPRADLDRLGAKPRELVVDLSPPVKTVRLNRSGRTLKVTPKLIIVSSLRISRSLGERKKLNEYVKKGSSAKLFRRLQSDLKALWRLYEYGCLHGAVRLCWGFLDEWRSVSWNVGGLPRLSEMLEEAKESGSELEMVFDSTTGWEDPWSRGARARVIGSNGDSWNRSYLVELVDFGLRRPVLDHEVFACRPFPEPAPPEVGVSEEDATAVRKGEVPKETFAWPEERDDRVS